MGLEQIQRLSAARQWPQAAALCRTLLQADPTLLPAWLELARAEDRQNHHRAAHDAVLQAAALTGKAHPMGAFAVATQLRRHERHGDLHDYVRRHPELEALPPDRLVELAALLASAGDPARALALVERAVAQAPDRLGGHNMRGLLAAFAGDDAGAAACLRRVIAIDPGFGPAYLTLARVQPATLQEHRIDAMRRQLQRHDLADAMRIQFGYALHMELDAIGDHPAAWEALMQAHAVQRRIAPYDGAADARALAELRRHDALWRQAHAAPAEQGGIVPVFIIGLHRSGTTLLERILSGHPDVVDAGETYSFAAELRLAANHDGRRVLDPAIAAGAGGYDYAAMGRGYRDRVRWRTAGQRVLTEKLNPNFMIAGPIALALPEARLLHMQRDPVDTCFSNLRTLFGIEAGYSNDPVQMADACALYREWMAHWHAVLPDRVVDVDYADLVAAPAAQAARLAEHCGLTYTPAMLDVGHARGTVSTASAQTVRKGVLNDRGGAWRPYAQALAPMLERLAAHGIPVA